MATGTMATESVRCGVVGRQGGRTKSEHWCRILKDRRTVGIGQRMRKPWNLVGKGNVWVADEIQKLTMEVLEAHADIGKGGMKTLNFLEIVMMEVLMQGESVGFGAGRTGGRGQTWQ